MTRPLSPPSAPLPPHPLFERKRDPRRLIGAAVSLLFHGFLIVLVVRGTVDAILETPTAGNPLLAPGGGGGGGGGGDGLRYISLPPLPRPPAAATAVASQPIAPPPEAETPTPTPPDQPEPTPVVVAPADSQPVAGQATGAAGTGPGSGGGSGGGTGGGVGPGVGPGSGPGTGGGGAGGTGRAPVWTYGTFFFEKPPKELRGVTLRVTFYVRADGRVDRVETDPEIRDGDFAKKFTERAETYRFRPARNAEGAPVPGIYTINFTLPSN